jgi:hypothetical protein
MQQILLSPITASTAEITENGSTLEQLQQTQLDPTTR